MQIDNGRISFNSNETTTSNNKFLNNPNIPADLAVELKKIDDSPVVEEQTKIVIRDIYLDENGYSTKIVDEKRTKLFTVSGALAKYKQMSMPVSTKEDISLMGNITQGNQYVRDNNL